jgi:hypothetical protein
MQAEVGAPLRHHGGGWPGHQHHSCFGANGSLALTFLLVAGDFCWMSWGLAKLLGAGEVPRGAQRWFLMGIAFRSLLLLLGIYGIFLILPKESLGVVLGIGCPLVLLTTAGAMPTRG